MWEQIDNMDALYNKREDKQLGEKKISGSFPLEPISFTRELVFSVYLCLLLHCTQRLTSLVDS